MTARLVVAGTNSGVGKTTISVGLMAALARRGLRVQGFKVGPDYIDPSYYAMATGQPGRNLDTWMMGVPGVCESFSRGCRDADIAVVEGVMGLFDGKSATGEVGSTAHLSKVIAAPVVLVVNGAGMARSIAALVMGFCLFDTGVRIAGVVVNRVSGERHYDLLRAAIEAEVGIPVVGGFVRDDELQLPERHLGLVPAVEQKGLAGWQERLADSVERQLDLDCLLDIAHAVPTVEAPECEAPAPDTAEVRPFAGGGAPVRIALALDDAFHFYYQDNLDLLERAGAILAPFSPLHDAALPQGCAAVYIGGGFPEEFAARLSANQPLHAALRAAAEQGMPMLAECGGLMYLCRQIIDRQGSAYPMAAVVPATARMQPRRAALGYAEVTAAHPSFVLAPGEKARGHEFHYSSLEDVADTPHAYQVESRRGVREEGFCLGNMVASYIHLHFASNPCLAPRFVAAARRFFGNEGDVNGWR